MFLIVCIFCITGGMVLIFIHRGLNYNENQANRILLDQLP